MRLALATFVAVVSALPAPAQEVRVAPGPIEVRVRSAADGAPLAGVVVHAGARCAATSLEGRVHLDGVPAGRYDLAIRHGGYEVVERPLDVPSGAREPIEIELVPAPSVGLSGRVALDEVGSPVSGARLTFRPVEGRAARRGLLVASTGWDGAFALREVPPGPYRVDVDATGCVPESFEIDVAEDTSEFELALAVEFRRADLAVGVRDAATGAPVAGALVTLGEAAGTGRIADARTGQDGRASFADLRVGGRNLADDQGRLRVARAWVVARIEAEGYETSIVAVALRSGGQVEVGLHPTAPVDEVEPNGSVEAAQEVRTGAPIRLALLRPDDADVFRFRVEHPAFLRIGLTSVPGLETHLTLLSAEGRSIAERGVYGGEPNGLAFGLRPGEYLVRVAEWGQNASSEERLTLSIDAVGAPDALEPNDDPGAARRVALGEVVRGALVPVGDADAFRFELPRDARVRFTMPAHPLERHLLVRDEGGRELDAVGVYAHQALERIVSLRRGEYVAVLTEWGVNAESTEPYTLRIEGTLEDGVEDPAGPSAARAIDPDGLVGATLDPVGDVDRYGVAIPSAGVLRVRAIGPSEILLRVLAADGTPLAQVGAYAGNPAELAWSAPGAALAFVEVREWGDNGAEPSPYTLSTRWEPCDEDEPDPIAEPDEPIRGSLCPLGLPVRGATALFDGIRDLLIAAACAVVDPRPVYATRKPGDAKSVVERMWIAPPETGSFVVRVETAVTAPLEPAEDAAAQSFERRTSLKLLEALATVHVGLGERQVDPPSPTRMNSAARGVSANLCEALGDILDGSEADVMEVSWRWAPIRPFVDAPIDARQIVSREVVPVLREIARSLRERTPRPAFEIEGYVVTLSSANPEAGGTVVVHATIDDRSQKVEVIVGPEDYARAIEWHKEGKRVGAVGALRREGRIWKLAGATDLREKLDQA